MGGFSLLTPQIILSSLEEALDNELTSYTYQLPSYINRVYELKDSDGKSYIVKFYRPGRWSKTAIKEEHEYILDCFNFEIPVAEPMTQKNNDTLGEVEGIYYAVFPKKAGRQFDVEDKKSWVRVGSLLGRIHNVGEQRKAAARINLTPQESTLKCLNDLQQVITDKWKDSYTSICSKIIETILPYFEGLRNIRIHGDFHVGNILNRLDEGLMVIDFDDMMNGPAVQDFWLLLPDHYPVSKPYLDLLLQGYRQFREFDSRSTLLIEGLRAMRLIYFTAWSALQREDFQFRNRYPDWGSDSFWSREVNDLKIQYANIIDSFEVQY